MLIELTMRDIVFSIVGATIFGVCLYTMPKIRQILKLISVFVVDLFWGLIIFAARCITYAFECLRIACGYIFALINGIICSLLAFFRVIAKVILELLKSRTLISISSKGVKFIGGAGLALAILVTVIVFAPTLARAWKDIKIPKVFHSNENR